MHERHAALGRSHKKHEPPTAIRSATAVALWHLRTDDAHRQDNACAVRAANSNAACMLDWMLVCDDEPMTVFDG